MSRENTRDTFYKLECSGSTVELISKEDLSAEAIKKNGITSDMVVVEKTFNSPGVVNVYPVPKNNFMDFLIEKIKERGYEKELENPFSE